MSAAQRRQLEEQEVAYEQLVSREGRLRPTRHSAPQAHPGKEHAAAIEWLLPKLRRLNRYSQRANAQYRKAMEIWRLLHL
jgi:hypothetical protein